jgi:amino acid transporter
VAGELIGLLFIVATLSAGRSSEKSETGQRLFTTPTVIHLAVVVVVSVLALAPGADNASASVLMVLVGLAATAYAVPIAIRISRNPDPTHWSDFWYYGAAPAICCLALSAAAATVVARLPHAAYYTGLVLLVLLALAIRNAWDLVTWLARRRGGG